MPDDEKELSRQDSLRIIEQMISTAKNEQKDNGINWIVWGWMLFSASVLTVFNLRFHWMETFFFWNLFGAATVVYFFVKAVRAAVTKSTRRVMTYTKSLYDKLNTGYFIMLMYIILSMNISVQPQTGFSLLIGLYGFWTLIYGAVLDFRPAMVASFVAWALGLVALFQKDFSTVMLLHAAAVLCGYVIPGHIANYRFKHKKSPSINQQVRV